MIYFNLMENNLKISIVTKRIGFLIGIAIFLFAVGLSGWFIYRDYVKHQVSNKVFNKVSNNEEQANGGQSSVISDSNIVEEIKKQMPDLDRKIVVTENLSTEVRLRAINDIGTIVAKLKEDYDRREEWLNLGIWRKTIGDYEGAAEAWKFATIIRPNDPVAFHNLGDLYSQYLPDFPKAEKYYLTAIEKDTSHQPFFYVKLYEFYLYYYKKPDLAEKILLDALKTNPDNEYLQKILDDLRQQ